MTRTRLARGVALAVLLALVPAFVPNQPKKPPTLIGTPLRVTAAEPIEVESVLWRHSNPAPTTPQEAHTAPHTVSRSLPRARPKVAPTTVPTTVPQPAVQPNRAQAPAGDVWAKLRNCEAGGDYTENTGNGYYGAYQADLRTWGHYAGYARADLAPPEVQDLWVQQLQARRGWKPWPACSRKLGLR